MKNRRNAFYSLLLTLTVVFYIIAQAQPKKSTPTPIETKVVFTSQAPKGIVRTIKQDKKGNIWITSWEGVFKYDGKSFINVMTNVSSARFFSILEDRNGNFWFASIGSGVYYYDGKTFQNFTTKDGLANDRVGAIYEDKAGNIWFGTESGASRYDGKSFQNLKMNEGDSDTEGDSIQRTNTAPRMDSVQVPFYQNPLPEVHWVHNDVNSIIEDKTGKFWFGTRGYATEYDGKTFTTITRAAGKPFANVRSIIKDRKGNIWLGGNDGLWRYDGSAFTNFTQNFVGYIYEDKKGNIWTSSEKDKGGGWELSRYDGNSVSDTRPKKTTIANEPMIFGILEDDKGNIWFGTLDGVYRYDGKTIKNFKTTAGKN